MAQVAIQLYTMQNIAWFQQTQIKTTVKDKNYIGTHFTFHN